MIVLAATARGRRLAAALADQFRAGAPQGPPRAVLETCWDAAGEIVLVMATGAAVRLVAPLLRDKHTDPAVVTVDDAGTFAVALVGGHHGANDLAARVAAALGATPVVTTASDLLDLPALDRLGAPFGLVADPASRADLPAVAGALLDGRPVFRWRSRPWPTGPLPGNVVDVEQPRAPGIVVSDELLDVPHPCVVYRPASLVVGVGCVRGAAREEILGSVTGALRGAQLSSRSVVHLASVDRKADEVGLLAAAAALGVPLVTHPAELLAATDVPNPSDVVRAEVGTPSVAEAAALAAGGELLVAKQKSANVTVAVARSAVRGRLALVSTGPGASGLIPPLAREALAAAEAVIGLDQYVARVREMLPPGCQVLATPVGEEVTRAEQAVALARAGRSVALISGGDVGVYAMASPALERAGDDVDVVVVPGVTAAVAAAALLGSPLGHDHCAISLSDLLTPWEVVRRRVKAAAEGDFVVSFYNPRSHGRNWQLEEARLLLLEHRKPDTPVGVVADAYRPGQRVQVTTLAELDVAGVDMLTIVVVGNTQTRVRGGRIVTPRGYA